MSVAGTPVAPDMDENLDTSSRLSRDDLKRLMARRDGPGLALFGVQLAAFVALAIATVQLGAVAHPLRWPAAAACGLVLLMFFASMHEAGHGTAFATPWLNRAVTWISAVLMLQAPTFFREFHFEHHRRTSDPHGDPEISGAPRLLGPWPANPLLYLALASGQHLMVGKAMFTLAGAVLPPRVLFAMYPFVRPALRRAVVWESRFVVLLLVATCWLGLRTIPGFAWLLVAWPVAHFGLGLFVMPEHTGLDRTGSQLHRTRSTASNALVRRAMWNMPYHSEHHAFPAVPFHAAPELSRRLGPEIENRSSGYAAFHLAALRRSLRRTVGPWHAALLVFALFGCLQAGVAGAAGEEASPQPPAAGTETPRKQRHARRLGESSTLADWKKASTAERSRVAVAIARQRLGEKAEKLDVATMAMEITGCVSKTASDARLDEWTVAAAANTCLTAPELPAR